MTDYSLGLRKAFGTVLGGALWASVMGAGAIALVNVNPPESFQSGQFSPLLSAPSLPTLGPAADYLPKDPGHLLLRLGERRVYVYRRDEVVASYPVAVGRNGWETPTGTFEVLQAVKDPTWLHPFTEAIVPPGKDNPLGVRWIGFWTDGTNYVGFHDTPHPELIGQAVSHGCVRMKNEDVIALFEQVEVGMPVIVEP